MIKKNKNLKNEILITNAQIFIKNKLVQKDLLIKNDKIVSIEKNINPTDKMKIIDGNEKIIVPGLIDIHVHLREPGQTQKETIKSGTAAAARGGFTTICCMPNTTPVIDNINALKDLCARIDKDAKIEVLPYAAITKELTSDQLVNFKQMAKKSFAYTNDGCGVNDKTSMFHALQEIKKLNKVLVAHVEDKELSNGGCIHDGEFSKKNNIKGISSKSEWQPLKRDLELVKLTKCRYHMCHISSKVSLQEIIKAKKNKLPVTCEVTPHHLLMCEKDISNDGCYKMNPPLRTKSDLKALISGIKDGSIDLIASDHAPHTEEEKARKLEKSMFGIVGLETSFPLMYTHFVEAKIISLKRLIELMSFNASKIFGIESNEIAIGNKANLMMFDPNKEYVINSSEFLSKGKSTPFNGWKVKGQPVLTIAKGQIVFQERMQK